MNLVQTALHSASFFTWNAPHEVCNEAITAVFVANVQRFAQSLLSIYSFFKYHPNAEFIFVLADKYENLEDLKEFLPSNSLLY
jgi:hypothetical protein